MRLQYVLIFLWVASVNCKHVEHIEDGTDDVIISSEWHTGAVLGAAAEAADERQDAQLLAAVTASMREWKAKRARTRSKRSQSSICYDDLGCFDDTGPFSYLETLPSPPEDINTHFLLYSTFSRGDQPLLDVPAANMSAAWSWASRAFDAARPTRVIVHGFGSNCDNIWVYEMRSALMAVEECNVVCVDWEGGATIPNYLRAAANTRLVGKQLALLLKGLAEYINLKFEDVHLIGFSLGAHVAGFAGSELGNISRITGLDPAGPLFEFQDSRARLDSGDARFVDVIHSNGENLILGGLGSWQPMGHVDFYPNGGRMQSGCSNLFVGAVSDIIWAGGTPEGRSLCNHRRAYKFFTDSVSPKCHFPAFPCSSYDDFLAGKCFPCAGGQRSRHCGNMGYYADRSTGRGQLYLLTREEEPFCAHQYHVTLQSSKGEGAKSAHTSYGKIMLTLVGDSGLNETFPMSKKEDTELVGGARVSRVLVPHPALGVPLRARLSYRAYAGWLSAGAPSWRLDKILISDSFGKKSSFCKKGLELISGESVNLPLYPGDCNIPQESLTEANTTDRSNITDNQVPDENAIHQPSFIPTQVVKIGDELIKKDKHVLKRAEAYIQSDDDNDTYEKVHKGKPSSYKTKPGYMDSDDFSNDNKSEEKPFSIFDAAEILNLPWQPLIANTLDDTPNAKESGRAFGVTNVKPIQVFHNREGRAGEKVQAVEIVEPVLKARPKKNDFAESAAKIGKEISEPILRSTYDIRQSFSSVNISEKQLVSNNNRHGKIYEDTLSDGSDTNEKKTDSSNNKTTWLPSLSMLSPAALWNRFNKKDGQDNQTEKIDSAEKSETFNLFQWTGKSSTDAPTANTSFTVQFLPTRLVTFLEKAERYARDTLLPLVSAYTPRFLIFGGSNSTDSKNLEKKYIPIETNGSVSNREILNQNPVEKMNALKFVGPPGSLNEGEVLIDRREDEANSQIGRSVRIPPMFVKKGKMFNEPGTGAINIVDPPNTFTTTALPPITVQSAKNSSEKVIIVYPSNARDDRKVQSHSYSEIMQFEALYPQEPSFSKPKIAEEGRGNKDDDSLGSEIDLRIDLPTYRPPRQLYSASKINASSPKFIPVTYPSNSADKL